MPQPEEVVTAHDQLLDTYRASERRIMAELEAIRGNVLAGRRAGRLQELLALVRAEMELLVDETRSWLDTDVPPLWVLGGTNTGLVDAYTFTALDRRALLNLTDEAMGQILEATDNVTEDARRWWRMATSDRARRSIVEGQTPQQAARELARAAPRAFGPDGPLNLRAVTYANGAVHSLADYSGMVMRTVTANAHNGGFFAQIDQSGVGFVEVFDGADCGLRSHRDPEKVNGEIYPADVVRQYLISHPNCRRAFGARPDIGVTVALEDAVPFQDPEVAAAAAAAERAAAEAQGATPTRRGRQPRTPRNARQPRTSRS